MKVRQSFISNSSSSSFVASSKTGKITITIEVDLSEYAKHVITNAEQLDAHFKDYYGGDDVSTAKRKVYTDALDRGEKIYQGSFSSESGEGLETFLCENGLPDDIKGGTVIESEGGY